MLSSQIIEPSSCGTRYSMSHPLGPPSTVTSPSWREFRARSSFVKAPNHEVARIDLRSVAAKACGVAAVAAQRVGGDVPGP